MNQLIHFEWRDAGEADRLPYWLWPLGSTDEGGVFLVRDRSTKRILYVGTGRGRGGLRDAIADVLRTRTDDRELPAFPTYVVEICVILSSETGESPGALRRLLARRFRPLYNFADGRLRMPRIAA